MEGSFKRTYHTIEKYDWKGNLLTTYDNVEDWANKEGISKSTAYNKMVSMVREKHVCRYNHMIGAYELFELNNDIIFISSSRGDVLQFCFENNIDVVVKKNWNPKVWFRPIYKYGETKIIYENISEEEYKEWKRNYMREYYRNNKEKFNNSPVDREKLNEYGREYYKENKEMIDEKNRKRYHDQDDSTKERTKAEKRKYYQENRKRLIAKAIKRYQDKKKENDSNTK